jgi:hypothetical protein
MIQQLWKQEMTEWPSSTCWKRRSRRSLWTRTRMWWWSARCIPQGRLMSQHSRQRRRQDHARRTPSKAGTCLPLRSGLRRPASRHPERRRLYIMSTYCRSGMWKEFDLQVGLHGCRRRLSMKRCRKTALPVLTVGSVRALASHPC